MGFEMCHPAVNLIFFVYAIYACVTFDHPVFILVSFVSAFVYSIKRNGFRALIFNLAVTLLAGCFALYYSSYSHFGVTVLSRNFIGNNVTLESLLRGGAIGLIASSVLMWASCIISVFTSDKVVYLFGRISPRLSLFISVLLRFVPRVKAEGKKIADSRRGIGRGPGQGNFFRRIVNSLSVFSAVISWIIESIPSVSDSMRSRGNSLRGRRSFSIYRFDNRDRLLVVTMFLLMTVSCVGNALGQNGASYDPRLIFPRTTPLSFIFPLSYLLFLIIPPMLETAVEVSFKRSRKAFFTSAEKPASRN